MTKKLYILILSLIAFGSAYSQTGNDTTKYVYYKFTYGEKFNRIWGTNVVDIPTDTIYSKYGIARKGLNIYVGNGTVWANVTGSGGGSGVSSFNTRTGAVTSLATDYNTFYFPIAGVHGTAGNMLYLGSDASAYASVMKYDSTNLQLLLPNLWSYIVKNGSTSFSSLGASFITASNGAQTTQVNITPGVVSGTFGGVNTFGLGNMQNYLGGTSLNPNYMAVLYLGPGYSTGNPGTGTLKFVPNQVTVPESGLFEYGNGGFFLFTDSAYGSHINTRDTVAGRAWARANITGGTGGGVVTSLTTGGTSGPSTLIGGVLNIPTYASGFADPLTTNGDIIWRSGGVTTRLPKGSNNTVLLTDNLGNVGYNLLTNSNLSGSAGITNANLNSMVGHTYKGNNTGSSAVPSDITNTQLTADLNQFTSSLQGLVPASTGTTFDFLGADKTWKKAYQPSDTIATLVTKTQLFNTTDTFYLSNIGTGASMFKILWTSGGGLRSSNVQGIGGVTINQLSDSLTTFAVDTTSSTGIASKNYVNARVGLITNLTTTGTSGPSTITGTTLNIPQYSGGGSSTNVVGIDTVTTITSGTSSTVPNGTNVIRFNNTSVLTYTLTLPTTWHTSNNLLIAFTANGTITSGNGMVTLTIVNGSGQTISQAINPNGTTFVAGEVLQYHLISTIDQRVN